MKNRVKGLLALCLAMCMVLAMTTVAFGETVYYGNIPDAAWKSMQAGDTITTYLSEGYGISFFVVKEDGTYWTEMNTEANGAHGTAYMDGTNPDSKVNYFANWHYTSDTSEHDHDIFTLPTMAGYKYNVQRVTVTEGALYSRLQDSSSSSGILMIANALKVTPVAKDGFTVKYDLNGGKIGNETSIAPVSNVAWTYKVLTNIGTPTREGFDFKGWKCQENTTAIIGDTTTYGSLAVTELPSITLTAVWEEIPDETPTPPTPTHQHTRRQPAATTVETPTTTVASPKTFDAGVAVYGVMAALSLTGTAAIIGKKRKF